MSDKIKEIIEYANNNGFVNTNNEDTFNDIGRIVFDCDIETNNVFNQYDCITIIRKIKGEKPVVEIQSTFTRSRDIEHIKNVSKSMDIAISIAEMLKSIDE